MPFLTPDSISPTRQTRLVTVSADNYLRAALTGSIFNLTDACNWEQFGAMTPDDCAAYYQTVFWDFMASNLIGLILPYATPNHPDFALPCDGTVYNKATNPEYGQLYGVLDSVFMLDADRFYVPDLRGRVPLGAGVAHPIGENGGAETHTLLESELPSHSHTDTGHTHVEVTAVPTIVTVGLELPVPSAIPGVGVTGVGFASLTNTGGGGAHNNLQPYLSIPYCIVYR